MQDCRSDLKAGFDDLDRVIADSIRFKLRLRIGKRAYASLRRKENLQAIWDFGGMAATGATVAASPIVATTFFAPSGFLALLGLGAAVTPIGWVAAAAIGSAGAYYGVTRLFGRFAGSRVDEIPKFITPPIDLLGATLLDLMGGLAVRVASIDGAVNDAELETITEHFVGEWGFDRAYVDRALHVLIANRDKVGIKELARQLALFQIDNPDCNALAMRSELLIFLKGVVGADGALDEREELALEAIEASMRGQEEQRIRRAAKQIVKLSSRTAQKVRATAVLFISPWRKSPAKR